MQKSDPDPSFNQTRIRIRTPVCKHEVTRVQMIGMWLEEEQRTSCAATLLAPRAQWDWSIDF